uniref:SUMO1 activating enzyme subunit 1 n=1 Tax=Tetraodon nigroviridis TaxID=99883 RepID=H3D7D5_TETNG
MIDMIEKEGPFISEEEAAQYDRQIRLWGLDAQKRFASINCSPDSQRQLNIKNNFLSVKELTMLDHEQVSEDSCRAQFLIPVTAQGKNRAQASLERAQNLNPMVKVHADSDRIEEKPDDFFLGFEAVCLTGCSKDLMVRIDQLCSQHNIKVFCGHVYGYYGYMFCNLGQEHNYIEEKPKIVKPTGNSDGPDAKKAKIDPNETIVMKKTTSFCTLKEALGVDWTGEKAKARLKKTPVEYFMLHVLLKFRTDKGRDPDPQTFTEDGKVLIQIRDDVLGAVGVGTDLLGEDFTSFCFSEMSPVCAVVGGVLGQEVVKAISQRDPPHRNFFFFDGRKGSGVVDYFGP